MARSTYIYIVERRVGHMTLAAFTVKWEMVEWLYRRPGNSKSEVQIFRFRDNGDYLDFVEITSDVFPLPVRDLDG